MKKYVLGIIMSLCVVSVVGCAKKSEIVETIAVESESTTEESVEEETTVNEDIQVIDLNLDLSHIVNDVVYNYDVYKDFGLTHGMLYTNGKKTGKSPSMTSIDPYVDGEDEVQADKVVADYYDYNILPFYETDEETLYEEYADYNEAAIIDEYYFNARDVDVKIPDGLDGEGASDLEVAMAYITQVGYYGVDYADKTKENGYITEDDWNAMSLDEKKRHMAKQFVYINTTSNKILAELNAESEEKNQQISGYHIESDDFDYDSPEYQAWLLKNQHYIDMVDLIDFTVDPTLPDYLTVDGSNVYMTKEQIKQVWEAQGSPESKVLNLEVYGYNFNYDVSNYKMD